jgi:hypothetical protein
MTFCTRATHAYNVCHIWRMCLQLLEAALGLTDKLAAMGLVLRAKPIVAGRYSAAPWTHYMQPLTATFRWGFL